MNLSLFIKGWILGLAIAAPVGPIGILCIRRSLKFGKIAGFISGLGAAFADSIYGAIAAFGITVVANILIDYQFLLRIVGGFVLIYLGIQIIRSDFNPALVTDRSQNLPGFFASTLFLTLTNPMTIISFGAIFSGLTLGEVPNKVESAIWIILGIFFGSTSWWWILSAIVAKFQNKLEKHVMVWINRISGLLIMTFGVIAITGII